MNKQKQIFHACTICYGGINFVYVCAKIYAYIPRKASLYAGGTLWFFSPSLSGYIYFQVVTLRKWNCKRTRPETSAMQLRQLASTAFCV